MPDPRYRVAMGARVTLARGDERVELELAPDPEARRPALVHAGGHAVSHIGPLPPGLRAAVLELTRGLVGLPCGSTAALVAALRARAHGFVVEARPRLAPVVWPSWLRSGRPALRDRLDLWPFDAELAALALGRRRLLKRECFSDDDEARDRAWLASHGLTCARVGPIGGDGRRTVLAAAAAIIVDEFAPVEAAAAHDRDAIAALGEALGYPPCCVEAWLARAGHDDATVVASVAVDDEPIDAELVWLSQPLALISHVPCAPRCAATLELASATLAALDDDVPGFAAAWRPLAARVHAIDRDGTAWALAGAGDLATGLTIDDAIGFPAPRGPGPVAVARPDRSGARLTRADVIAAADHRVARQR